MGEADKRLGVTRQALSALLNDRVGVSAKMALRLAAALGTSGAAASNPTLSATFSTLFSIRGLPGSSVR